MCAAVVETVSTSAIHGGVSAPLGATVRPGGVNFSVFSKNATLIELLLFEDQTATAVAGDSPRATAAPHLPLLARLRAGSRARAGVRLSRARPLRRRSAGLRFDGEKVLLDPYGLAVAVPDALRPSRRSAPGRQIRDGHEERRRRSRRATTGRATPRCGGPSRRR